MTKNINIFYFNKNKYFLSSMIEIMNLVFHYFNTSLLYQKFKNQDKIKYK